LWELFLYNVVFAFFLFLRRRVIIPVVKIVLLSLTAPFCSITIPIRAVVIGDTADNVYFT